MTTVDDSIAQSCVKKMKEQSAEIKLLRAQLAEERQQKHEALHREYCRREELERRLVEVTSERNEWKDSAINGGNATYLREQLLATQAHAARLVDALDEACETLILANKELRFFGHTGFKEELKTLRKALSTPINLDALHEHAAQVLIAVAEKFEHGCENAPASPGAWIGRTLRDEAAAHRAKKGR